MMSPDDVTPDDESRPSGMDSDHGNPNDESRSQAIKMISQVHGNPDDESKSQGNPDDESTSWESR